jgi:leucyl-tRNA synthetase
VGTGIKYGVFVVNDKEAFVSTLRAARNMAFQGTITPRGHIEKLAEIDGSKIVGTKIHAPFAINPQVYVLPMDNVLPTKVKLY